MGHSAKIIADSVSPAGHRLTTFEIVFPRIVLAEFNTHRLFSRNSASSRAIPITKMIEMAENDPYIPTHWGKNQKGMQAYEELSPEAARLAKEQWLHGRDHAVDVVRRMQMPDIDLHKQTANRLLEPWLWHTVVVSSTEWSNWGHLRDHHAAHPEIQKPASSINFLLAFEKPKKLLRGQWHLPYTDVEDQVTLETEMSMDDSRELLKKVSVGRCASVSYMRQNVHEMKADEERCQKMLAGGHMSPFEHVARPMTEIELETYRMHHLVLEGGFTMDTRTKHTTDDVVMHDGVLRKILSIRTTHFCGNFNGWVQYRKTIPYEHDILAPRD